MRRREALQQISLGFGITITGAGLITAINSCKSVDPLSFVPSFFNESQARVVNEVLEVILPATDTPGAKELGIIQTIDQLAANLFEADQKEMMAKSLASFINQMVTEFSVNPENPDPIKVKTAIDSKVGSLSESDQERISELVNQNPKEIDEASQEEYDYYSTFLAIKQMAINTYFQSEEIGENHLSYLPIPGAYEGCIPVAEVGNSWSL